MEAPKHIQARLKRIDRNLSLKWDNRISRWTIYRRNPVRPNLPPEKVHVWQTPGDLAFLPLDDRLFDWINGCDLQRKFYGRDERYWGAMFDAEMQEIDARGAAMRAKQEQDELERLEDGLNFMWRNERRRIKPETVNP